jgi:hypothetical protein
VCVCNFIISKIHGDRKNTCYKLQKTKVQWKAETKGLIDNKVTIPMDSI